MRGKNTAASLGARAYAVGRLKWGAVMWNATINGFMNMYTGPDSVSGRTKYGIGFVAGALEMGIGLEAGPTIGGVIGSTFSSTLNEAFSEDPFLSWKTAGRIGLNAAIGAAVGKFGAWYDPDSAREWITLFLINLDRQLGTKAYQEQRDFWKSL